MKRILAMIAIVAFAFALPSCKGKSDADIQKDVEAKLAANPDFSGLTANVSEGTVTISGSIKDDATKATIDPAIKDVKGVKAVVNNASVPPPPVINNDEALNAALKDAVKDHAGVTAVAVDSIVTLTGEIKRADLATLLQKVNATHPKKVDNKLTVK